MKLHVRVCSARNLKNKRTLGVQDPYCEIKVGGKKVKTKVHENGDTAPEWDEAFDFSSVDSDDKLAVNVMDEKSFRANCLLGKCRLPVNLFLSGNVVDQWYGLTNEDGDKPAGEINLRVQLEGAGVQASAQPEAEPYAKQYSTSSSYEPSSSKTTVAVAVETTSAPEQASYQQPQYSQPPQQYSQPPPGHYAPPPEYARQPSQPAPGYYAPPPQPGYYAQPPPQQYGHQQYPAYGYPPQGGVAYAAGPPVMVSRGEPSYGHYDHYERRHSGDYGNNGNGGGMSTGQLALGVGAGVVGGLLLEDAIEDVFDDDD